MSLSTLQRNLICRVWSKGKQSESKPKPEIPSGGSNPSLTADEKAFRDKLSPIVFEQLEGAFKRVLAGTKPDAIMPTSKAEDKKVVDAVRPVWFKLFKKGGDEGLKLVRRFPKAAKKMVWFTKEMIEQAEVVEVKAPRKPSAQIVIPEWVEDPEVLSAIERELFKFAHSINQTTADKLRQTMLYGMEEGMPLSDIANSISLLSDEWAEGWHAEMIARTESARAISVGRVEAWKSTGVVERKVWHAAGDACPFCLEMDGKVIGLEENFFDEGDSMSTEWQGHDIEMDFGYADVNGPPLHPNCLVHGSSQVYTSKGWKPIRDIKERELVMTHKGRFRKVTKTIRSIYRAGITKITFGKSGRMLTVTDDHPVLVNGKWTAAKEIKKGDSLSVLGRPCARCGKVTMWNMKYCSHTCLSLDITDKQWADPNHRKIIARKNTASMNRQYKTGKRDRFEITKGMNEAVRKLSAQGKWNHMNPVGLNRWAKSAEGRAYSHRHMIENNPTLIPEVRERMTASYKRTMLLHPEKHPNMIMAQNGFMSSIERKVKELLDALGIEYVQQHPVDRFFVDFAIPSLNVAIEVGGHYWHKDKSKDRERQDIIESKGWHVVRFSEDKINKNLNSVSQELVRIAANHAGEYQFAKVKVLSVERWNLKRSRAVYNLSVKEDESYIAKGLVVHNCRCVLMAVATRED